MLAVMSGCGCAGTPVTPTAWYVGFLESGPPNGTGIVHFPVSPSNDHSLLLSQAASDPQQSISRKWGSANVGLV